MSVAIRNQSNAQRQEKKPRSLQRKTRSRLQYQVQKNEPPRKGYNMRPKASDTKAIAHLIWESSSEDLSEVLRRLQENTSAYVHPRPISFETKFRKKKLELYLQDGLDSIWIGNAGWKSQRKWNCIFNTAQWIQQSTSLLAIPFQGPDDKRLYGFHQIKCR